MSMVKSAFISVLTGQHEGIGEYFPLLDSDDRIEVSFCVLRAMFSGVNFDCSQFVERASSSMTIDGIFSRREDLRRASRHLVAVAPGSGVATQDHMNPATRLRTFVSRALEAQTARAARSSDIDSDEPMGSWLP